MFEIRVLVVAGARRREEDDVPRLGSRRGCADGSGEVAADLVLVDRGRQLAGRCSDQIRTGAAIPQVNRGRNAGPGPMSEPAGIDPTAAVV